MRIITGSAKGKRLLTLEGETTRPTSDRIKEAMFSSIQFDIEGRRVLDLFAGCGQLGLEALSRGAASAMFVDASSDAIALVKKNIAATGFREKCRTLVSDYRNYLRKAGGKVVPFDLVFLDPPYAMQACTDALCRLVREDLLAPGALVVMECGEEVPAPEKAGTFEVLKSTRYGKKTGIEILLYRGKGKKEENPEEGSVRAAEIAVTEVAVPETEKTLGEESSREKKKERVILPGTYDPVTLGHLDIIRRAAAEYEEVFVTVFVNPDKTPLFSLSDRLAMLMLATDDLDNVLVTESAGLVIDYMRDHHIRKIVKGYRNDADLAYEEKQAEWNAEHGGVTTDLLPCAKELRDVSSTLARRLLAEGGDLSGILPEKVLAFLKNREEKH